LPAVESKARPVASAAYIWPLIATTAVSVVVKDADDDHPPGAWKTAMFNVAEPAVPGQAA